MSKINTVIAEAIEAHKKAHPRAQYALDVLAGRQRWSGADLKGKANKYGGHYARQRARAAMFLFDAGGKIVPGANGLLISATRIGTDDEGNELLDTLYGVRRASDNGKRVVPIA